MLLDGLGVRFSPDYTCFNGAGEVIESGRLVDQPYFAAATATVGRYLGTPGFKLLALMAAEVHGVNELLNKGSKPENITTSPAALFMEPPTGQAWSGCGSICRRVPAAQEAVVAVLVVGKAGCHADRLGSACSPRRKRDIGSGPGAHMPTPSRRYAPGDLAEDQACRSLWS